VTNEVCQRTNFVCHSGDADDASPNSALYSAKRNKAGWDYLYEAKLLIVGEGGAGKTSLARRIVRSDAALPEEEKDTTRGIEITRWEFPLNRADAPNTTFRVNIWDFGGQQIYHATHQFFLTKRSLYALVAESRKEDHDFYGWLNRVELFGESSPVFIVKNRKFGRGEPIRRGQNMALIALEAFLSKKDPDKQWGGLRQHTDGRWLCQRCLKNNHV